MSESRLAAQVCVLVEARSLDRAFDYAVPPELDSAAQPGSLVACSLGSRRVLGVVVSREPPTHTGRLASLLGIVDVPPIPPDLLDLVLWTAEYYRAPIASALRLALPPGAEGSLRERAAGGFELIAPSQGRMRLVVRPGTTPPSRPRHEQVLAGLGPGPMPAAELCRAVGTTMPTLRRMADEGIIALVRERAEVSAVDWLAEQAPDADVPPELSAGQERAVQRIESALGAGEALLLHGVTGSGKTEVYLRAIAAVRDRGQSAILLVPEISLTPQTVRRVRARFGERAAIWHSGLTGAERVAEYARVRKGAADVIVGARSAIFAPVPNLGLVIVDEEHDSSYKQDSTPRYDARRLAYERATRTVSAVVYGSATPRVETWHALEHVRLPERIDAVALPRIEVVDMRTQRAGPLSRPLERALRDACDRGEKAIVLLNRRGFSLMVLCRSCGWIARCPSCDVAMVLHRGSEAVVCHHCGHHSGVPSVCPECRSTDIARQGAGTEALEDAVATAVPKSRLVRMDAGTASGRGAVGRLLAEFSRPGPAILIGTQMVAKGHDLPDVTVAGVVGADAGLQRPDFRAEERTFSLIVQLAGRAGRRGEAAKVIVQAYEPRERSVELASEHDVAGFLDAELERRRGRGFPPFSHLVRLLVEGDDADQVVRVAAAIGQRVRQDNPELPVLGPAPQHRLRGRFRRSVIARAPRAAQASAALERAVAGVAATERQGLRIVIDVDPQDG